MTCFRFFGFTSFRQVDELTIRQYRLMIRAQQYKSVDQDYRSHLQAYLTMVANAEKSAGKGKTKKVFTKFVNFFNYQKALDSIDKKKDQSEISSKLSQYLKNKEKDNA